MPLRVSISGIRGVIGDGLDALTVTRWASAFGAWLPPGPVVVGRDTRVSGPMVLDAVSAALVSTGHDVWDIGIATTPTTEVAVQESNAVGGVIITASHNPKQWNALKFLALAGVLLWFLARGTERLGYNWQWYRVPRLSSATTSVTSKPSAPMCHNLRDIFPHSSFSSLDSSYAHCPIVFAE
jgi:hypothetical protein